MKQLNLLTILFLLSSTASKAGTIWQFGDPNGKFNDITHLERKMASSEKDKESEQSDFFYDCKVERVTNFIEQNFRPFDRTFILGAPGRIDDRNVDEKIVKINGGWIHFELKINGAGKVQWTVMEENLKPLSKKITLRYYRQNSPQPFRSSFSHYLISKDAKEVEKIINYELSCQ